MSTGLSKDWAEFMLLKVGLKNLIKQVHRISLIPCQTTYLCVLKFFVMSQSGLRRDFRYSTRGLKKRFVLGLLRKGSKNYRGIN